MVPPISKKVPINLLFQIALPFWPIYAYCSFVLKYVFCRTVCLALLSTSACRSGDEPFPGFPDSSVRAPACRSHQLGAPGCMDRNVVKVNWPSVWGWWRHILEMILDNIHIDVLPQGWLEGFCFACFFQQTCFKNSWLHLAVCFHLLFRIFWQSPKPPQRETKLEKGRIQSLEENMCGFHENHLSIGAWIENVGRFSGQDSQELAASCSLLFNQS